MLSGIRNSASRPPANTETQRVKRRFDSQLQGAETTARRQAMSKWRPRWHHNKRTECFSVKAWCSALFYVSWTAEVECLDTECQIVSRIFLNFFAPKKRKPKDDELVLTMSDGGELVFLWCHALCPRSNFFMWRLSTKTSLFPLCWRMSRMIHLIYMTAAVHQRTSLFASAQGFPFWGPPVNFSPQTGHYSLVCYQDVEHKPDVHEKGDEEAGEEAPCKRLWWSEGNFDEKIKKEFRQSLWNNKPGLDSTIQKKCWQTRALISVEGARLQIFWSGSVRDNNNVTHFTHSASAARSKNLQYKISTVSMA